MFSFAVLAEVWSMTIMAHARDNHCRKTDDLMMQAEVELDYELGHGSKPESQRRSEISHKKKKTGKKKKKDKTHVHNNDFDQGVVPERKVPPVYRHMAVRLDNNIVMFGGSASLQHPYTSCRAIYVYNLDSRRWKKFMAQPTQSVPPETFGACAVAMTAT